MSDTKRLAFYPGRDDYGRRIDRILRKFLPSCPLGALYGALRKKDIRVGNKKVSPDYKVSPGDVITVSPHFAQKWELPLEDDKGSPAGETSEISPSAVIDSPALPPVPILIETQDLLVLDKPAGVLTHGKGSLEEAVRVYLAPKLPRSLSFSPGPLHRLDRNTSGAVFFSKSIRGARSFSELLRQGRVVKVYIGLIEGNLPAGEAWTDLITRDGNSKISSTGSTSREGREVREGKTASLTAEPLASRRGLTLVQFTLHTGRTHQIRAQCAGRGIPLGGDIKYGGRTLGELGITGAGLPPYLLHAALVRAGDTEGARTLGVGQVIVPLPGYLHSVVTECFGPETAKNLTSPSTGRER